jgi:hypothetical protein
MTQFITAGRAFESVPDCSVFKQLFLNSLDGLEPGLLADGILTGQELGTYLKDKVPEYNPMQHPQYGTIGEPKEEPGGFVFAPGQEGMGAIANKGEINVCLGGVQRDFEIVRPGTKGELRVDSDPRGGRVYLDGKDVGQTPIVLSGLRPGEYTVRIVKQGYEQYYVRVEVTAEERKTVFAYLEATDGGLVAKSEPKDAKVYLDGSYVGTTPFERQDLSPGSHRVRITKEGYRTWERDVTIKAGDTVQFVAPLKRAEGGLSAKSEPKGAKVYLDGKMVGSTPFEGQDLSPGAHTVRITKDGYQTWERDVTVKAEETVEFVARLKRAQGGLVAKSEPKGAEVYVNGKSVGKTPYEDKGLAVGSHTVHIKKHGYGAWEQTVQVDPGKTVEVMARLRAEGGRLLGRSEPNAAKMYLDGKHIGTTPVEQSGVSPGSYAVRVTKPGYESWEGSVVVETGKTAEVMARLKRAKGELSANSDPRGATVYLDGQQVGTTPLERFGLEPGSHSVRMAKEGYRPWEREVSIKTGETEELLARLTALKGSLLARSDPKGANVYVNGKSVGRTPVEQSGLEPGSHTVRFVKEGFETWERHVKVHPGEKVEVLAQLTAAKGDLVVHSKPAGAKVYVDGQSVGASPAERTGLSAGPHGVLILKEGYESWEREVVIEPGETEKVTARLKQVEPSGKAEDTQKADSKRMIPLPSF